MLSEENGLKFACWQRVARKWDSRGSSLPFRLESHDRLMRPARIQEMLPNLGRDTTGMCSRRSIVTADSQIKMDDASLTLQCEYQLEEFNQHLFVSLSDSAFEWLPWPQLCSIHLFFCVCVWILCVKTSRLCCSVRPALDRQLKRSELNSPFSTANSGNQQTSTS